ncbi:tyrosine-type recombinase/integrase [Rhizobium sp. CC-YZS058]|uniref:tyrosine-type recombinase/integrase n=1 Tax=Rhizobium sp. CC-YZS058 TaxID=3042153 RepID=UPI002B058D31|nr:tyrosine-type recombinase/integrase [Rhizobium sp. CC-YZS058]MEA3534252.1 tyrosine-type recombinase/integrase [Rhizobium sp. CC-YZS058]
MTDDSYPYVSAFRDRHGKTRFRYRRHGKTIALPGAPGEPEFEEAYSAAVEGRERRVATVVSHPGSALPGSFKAAWRKVQRGPEWLAFDPQTQLKNMRLAGEFLTLQVAPPHPEVWGDMAVRDLKRRHVKEILAHYAATPHKAKHILVALRKMIAVALDEEWIETDPTWKLSYRPEYVGWRAWTDAEREAFEARWPLGSTPRTVYGLALWLGNRRSDLAKLEWSAFDFQRGQVVVEQTKGGKRLVLPLTPMLREILTPLERKSRFVIVTAYGEPFSDKSLTGRMADWTHSAGLPKGCTIHGLRKTLGKLLAETGATTRQLMETLGHDNIEHAELYSRAAEQQRLARDAMSRLTRKYKAGKPTG